MKYAALLVLVVANIGSAACGTARPSEQPAAASPSAAASAPAAPPSSPDPITAVAVASDGPLQLAEGVTVEAAQGWWATSRPGALTLQDPERLLAITTVVV